MYFCARFQETFGNLCSSLENISLCVIRWKWPPEQSRKPKHLLTYPMCRRKVPCCFGLFFFFTLVRMMKTSETVRIYTGRFGSLFRFSWPVTYRLISELACILPEHALCDQTKFSQLRQKARPLRLPCADNRQVLVAVNQCSYTEINKPQQFILAEVPASYFDDFFFFFFACSLFFLCRFHTFARDCLDRALRMVPGTG